MKMFIAIRNDDVIDRLIDMGYNTPTLYFNGNWIFIILKKKQFGELVIFNLFNSLFDIEVDIDDVPLRKDLKEWVRMFDEGTKMGLL